MTMIYLLPIILLIASIFFIITLIVLLNEAIKRVVKAKAESEKHLKIMDVYDKWLEYVCKGNHISDYLKQQGFEDIGIYGLGYLGKRLAKELLDTAGINIKCIIDNDKNASFEGIEIISMEEEIPNPDVIIVTPVNDFYEIKKKIQELTNSKVIFINQLFDE